MAGERLEADPIDPLLEWDCDRRVCPVAHEEDERSGRRWLVHGHPEALEVLNDHSTFSSRVSAHLSIPSGMDPPEHSEYRSIVDRYFTPPAMGAFEPHCREIAAEAVEAAVRRGGGEALSDLGQPCAVRMQCEFMGWPEEMQRELTRWQEANEEATRSGDRTRTAAVAGEFERHVGRLLARRRSLGEGAPDDVTTRLLREEAFGRPLTGPELISIIRNWTAGELGSIAAGIGIIVHELCSDPELVASLRAEPQLIATAVDEILRKRGPLVSNRRVATLDTELGGQRITAGDRVVILWPSVNRDERVFERPAEVDLERDQSRNLLYGAGIHVCPGVPLARLELRVFTEELLARSSELSLDPQRPAVFAAPPKGGFTEVHFRVRE